MRVIPCFLLLAGLVWGDTVELRDGDVLTGIVVEQTATHVVLDHPDLGILRVPLERVAGVVRFGLGGEPGEEYAGVAGEAAPVERPPEPKWTVSVGLGGTLTNDNEGEKLDLTTLFKIERSIPSSETFFSAFYLLRFTDKVIDKDNLTARLTQTWLNLENPWSTFLSARYDFDEFRSWDQRIIGHGGAGYRVLDDQKLRWTLLAGAGLRKDFGSIEEAFRVEAQLGATLVWTPVRRHSLSLSLNYFPSIHDADYRVSTLFDWKYLLDAESSLSLVSHIDWEFATDPDPGFPENNVRWTWNLQWDF